MSKVRVKCGYCDGNGDVLLTGVYADTLQVLRRMTRRHGYVVSNRDSTAFKCKPTALNNRLVVLEQYGLATSERYGRQRRFRAS